MCLGNLLTCRMYRKHAFWLFTLSTGVCSETENKFFRTFVVELIKSRTPQII